MKCVVHVLLSLFFDVEETTPARAVGKKDAARTRVEKSTKAMATIAEVEAGQKQRLPLQEPSRKKSTSHPRCLLDLCTISVTAESDNIVVCRFILAAQLHFPRFLWPKSFCAFRLVFRSSDYNWAGSCTPRRIAATSADVKCSAVYPQPEGEIDRQPTACISHHPKDELRGGSTVENDSRTFGWQIGR